MVSSGPVQGLSNSVEEQLLHSEASPSCQIDDTTALQQQGVTQHIIPSIPSIPAYKSATQVFRPIRPVSPSTLMALTEPCLMAWCTEVSGPGSLPPPPVYRSYPTSVQVLNPQVRSNLGQQGRNRWGY
ncbi:hypothetical protein BDZ94DRAFT_1261252 [Collybia nuda]|uniref:Uncharacterized protein n=1 Tax=Collybia nuda TaxID=64659 RepID=A0A9P5Y487_9AGAR|nr:hypothetical protein BDZ94DRAFT_1261252 [Collybia nuda]